MWQELREELHPQGLEVVTVALDAGGWEHARPFIERANPKHPSLLDEEHTLGSLFGVVNVPSGIWIDEEQIIVRPPGPAWPGKSVWRETMNANPVELPPDTDPVIVKSLGVSKQIRAQPERFIEALRDWVEHGAASRYALAPGEVVARSRERGPEVSRAAAHFELGQHLFRAGDSDGAVEHFKQAHALQPDNWTYKRQAYQFVSPILQDARAVYGTTWADEVEKAGPESYYTLDLD